MSDETYPMPIRKAIKTLTEICKYQNRKDLVEILENAHPEYVLIDYDNWNGGTSTYRLHLGLATRIYALHQYKINVFEKEILERVASFDKAYENDHLDQVMITPLTEEAAVYGQRRLPSEIETKHIWVEGHFKLFLSHLAENKVKVHKLKSHLRSYGISAFVAHDDIKPSKEWQNEIELALRSMDSLAALVTPKFIESSWCDQEIGWALGRSVPVFPIRLGCDPYGFAGKIHAISGSLDKPDDLAKLIFETIRDKSATNRAICRAMPAALMQSPSYAISNELGPVIASYEDYTDSEKEILWKACEENDQVKNSFAAKRIYNRIGQPSSKETEEEPPPF